MPRGVVQFHEEALGPSGAAVRGGASQGVTGAIAQLSRIRVRYSGKDCGPSTGGTCTIVWWLHSCRSY